MKSSIHISVGCTHFASSPHSHSAMAREGEGFALETQLHVAARGGEVERLKRLILQRADVNKAGLGLGVIFISLYMMYILIYTKVKVHGTGPMYWFI